MEDIPTCNRFPKLQELCGCVIHRSSIDYRKEKYLPKIIKDYLSDMTPCRCGVNWYNPIARPTCWKCQYRSAIVPQDQRYPGTIYYDYFSSFSYSAVDFEAYQERTYAPPRKQVRKRNQRKKIRERTQLNKK